MRVRVCVKCRKNIVDSQSNTLSKAPWLQNGHSDRYTEMHGIRTCQVSVEETTSLRKPLKHPPLSKTGCVGFLLVISLQYSDFYWGGGRGESPQTKGTKQRRAREIVLVLQAP